MRKCQHERMNEMENKKKETAIITLRVEKELLKEIDQSAEKEHRSRTAQIVHMITQYYKARNEYMR